MCCTTLRRRVGATGGQAALLVTSLACCGCNASAAAQDGPNELDKLFYAHAQVGAPAPPISPPNPVTPPPEAVDTMMLPTACITHGTNSAGSSKSAGLFDFLGGLSICERLMYATLLYFCFNRDANFLGTLPCCVCSHAFTLFNYRYLYI